MVSESLFSERSNMRYSVFSLTMALFLASAASAQDVKKKDAGKEKDPNASKSMEISDVQGRSFREWQREIKDPDPSKREVAIKTILQFGPDKAYDAVPDIIAELSKHTKKPVDLSVRVTGTVVLSTIFKFKKEPEDPKLKEALAKNIKDAVAIYKVFLRDEQLMMRVRAVQGLPFLGPTSRDALTEVILMAKEPATWEARKEAIQTLGMIGFEDNGKPKVVMVMSEVFKALDDRSFQVRVAAIRACASLAMKAEPPVKSQVFARFRSAIETDPDKHVVLAAHQAHMALEGKVTPAHLNPIVKTLKNENPEVRLDALQNIGTLGKEAKSALPAVLECTDDPEVNVAVNAVMVAMNVDPEGAPIFLGRIKNNTRYPDAVRVAAADSLAFLDGMAREKKKTEK